MTTQEKGKWKIKIEIKDGKWVPWSKEESHLPGDNRTFTERNPRWTVDNRIHLPMVKEKK